MSVHDFELQHPAGVRISRRLTEAELSSSLPVVASSKIDMHTGWVWYRLPPFPDAEVVVGIGLGFKAGALEMVILSDAHPKFGASWNDWSEKSERLRVSSIGSWLSSKGFSVGSHTWGSIGVGYDAKGGFGSATVRLAAQQGAPADRSAAASQRQPGG